MAKKRLNKAFYMNKLLIAIFFIVITLSCNLIFVQALTSPILPGQSQKPLGKIENSSQHDTSNVSFSELLGGNGTSFVNDVAYDASGSMYITGKTNSPNFPIKNAYQTNLKGGFDAFIAKFNSTGYLVMSTYFGGSEYDYGSSITIDSAGNIYITGVTASLDFPTKNAYQPNLQGGLGEQCVFIAKFNPFGQLLFSTYLGGSKQELSGSIAVDSLGNIIITGATSSADFPLVKPIYNTLPAQAFDSVPFIAKFNSTGTLVFSTLLSGGYSNEYDWISSIVVDSADDYYVTGYTNSLAFPIKNAYQANFTQNPFTNYYDAFITKFNATNGIVFSTYLGGSKNNEANSIAIDQAGNIYVSGITDSSDFPIKNGYATFNGSFDVFLSKFSSSDQLLYSTFLGGKGVDIASQIAVDQLGNIFIAGTTNSTDFPTKNAFQSFFKGSESNSMLNPVGWDTFLVKLTNNGTFAYGTYLTGSKNDLGVSIAVDSHGDIYLAGDTDSTGLPWKGTYDKFTGSQDIYIAKFTSVPFSFPPKPVAIDFVSLTIIGISTITIVFVSLYVLVEYRQYRKTKGKKNLLATTKEKDSFRTHLLNKIHKKHAKQVQYTLSEKSLEILEEMLEENK